MKHINSSMASRQMAYNEYRNYHAPQTQYLIGNGNSRYNQTKTAEDYIQDSVTSFLHPEPLRGHLYHWLNTALGRKYLEKK